MIRFPSLFFASAMLSFAIVLNAQPRPCNAGVWVPDNSDGTYKNPVLYADYSDPDVVRVGNDYYLTSSSFSNFPGLPILHSNDLVNWKIVGHAVSRYPFEEFSEPRHGMAIWAPAIRFHHGEYYIYFGDPDRGIFMTKAKNPAGTWEPLQLIRKATGWIDPCPLWDDDGKAYIIHAWANSRSGKKSILTLNTMNREGTEILDTGLVVFDGHATQPTIEGPKFYKRNGYYYIFAPAGGVKPGWQTVLRSKNVYGPYEERKVLEQGSTKVNGPHQGAWVDTRGGQDWFMHFQDRYAYGRIVHLEPMRWEHDWPVMGNDEDKNGIGEPVETCTKPQVGRAYPVEVPQTSDEFTSSGLGLQWQWEANGNTAWYSLNARKGWMRLYAHLPSVPFRNLWSVPNLMLQKIPAPEFNATTKLDFSHQSPGARAGLVVFGLDYSSLCISRTTGGPVVSQIICRKADKDSPEETVDSTVVTGTEVYLRVEIKPENETDVIPKVLCSFSYSVDGAHFRSIGKTFVAREGQWVGAKVGVFSIAGGKLSAPGYTDFDWFRFEPMERK